MKTVRKNIQGIIRLSRYQEHFGATLIISSLAVVASQRIVDYKTVSILVANILANTFAFMFNDVEDEQDDRLDVKKRKRNPVSSGLLSKKNAILVTIISASGAMLFYSFGGRTTSLLGGSTLIFGTLYSLKQIRLKKYPITDIVSHGLFHAALPYLAMYSLGEKGLNLDSSIPLVAVLLLSIAADLRNELRDQEVDKLSGFKNTLSIIGKDIAYSLVKWTKVLCPTMLIAYIFIHISFEAKLAFILYGIILVPLILFFSKTKRMLLGSNQEGLHFLNGSVILMFLYVFPNLFLFY